MKILIILGIILILYINIIILTIIETHLSNKILKILLKLHMLFLVVFANILIWLTLIYWGKSF